MLGFQFWREVYYENNDPVRIRDVDRFTFPRTMSIFLPSNAIGNLRSKHHKDSYQIAETNSDIKTRLKFNTELNRFQHFSPNYDFIDSTPQVLNSMTDAIKKKARLFGNVKKSVVINSVGVRAPSKTELTTGNIIDEKFQQQTYTSNYQCQNTCVWLSASMAINSVDKYEADKMIYVLNQHPKQFEWLNLFYSKDKNSLYQELVDVKSNYRVQKVNGVHRDEFLTYFENNCVGGLFVAVVKSQYTGERSHAIGLNMWTKVIYDCMENRDMPFSRLNLNRCCGPNKFFHRFEYVCEIKQVKRKLEI